MKARRRQSTTKGLQLAQVCIGFSAASAAIVLSIVAGVQSLESGGT